MASPYKPQRDAPRRRYPTGKVVTLSISLPKDLKDAALKRARNSGRSVSGYVADILIAQGLP